MKLDCCAKRVSPQQAQARTRMLALTRTQLRMYHSNKYSRRLGEVVLLRCRGAGLGGKKKRKGRIPPHFEMVPLKTPRYKKYWFRLLRIQVARGLSHCARRQSRYVDATASSHCIPNNTVIPITYALAVRTVEWQKAQL
eukprot:3696509-Rhodomonas_salina.1